MKGMSGNSGTLSGQELIDGLRKLKASGTLVLSQGAGSIILLLNHGELQSSFRLGSFSSLDDDNLDFRVEWHPPAAAPRLQSHFGSSRLAVMQALPQLGPGALYPVGPTDLRALVSHLRCQEFTGSLTLTHRTDYGVVLFLNGQIGAALFERNSYTLERSDALRAIFRYSLSSNHPPLTAHRLNPLLVRSLLGLAYGRHSSSLNLDTYSGLVSEERGYLFYQNGQAFLRVEVKLRGTSRRYLPLDPAPDLHLPDDPPGWEEFRYALTLRGKDALNPMTELSMHFREAFGPSGRAVLEILGGGGTIEQAAMNLDIELQELKPWLKRLEDEGFIRLSE